ncbi:glycosyltransferase family A protein [uncultured Flavobacterium sp.]|uniref:glycosyltransferase family A protein n=1 Tax=uncultured Flavobacterium sp. TaxID=165435 RepID=UPI0030EF0B51|tara:strand:+ start:12041 stop:13027 length:987 start_codon:yes stop_codon:yes gene_type:complete
MRIGSNPNSHKVVDISTTSHRVIIPVYIPNAEGYFKDALNVFKVCINSLVATINSDTAISIVSNGSSAEVNEYIYSLCRDGKVDRAVFNNENVGKMNAVIAETRASFEEFVTYSDADVFFDKGWLKQTFAMFQNVSKAGFVSMNPTPGNYTHADSTLIKNLFAVLFERKKTSTICDFSDLEHFHKSTGQNSSFTEKKFQSYVFCVSEENYIIGAGHFCCSIRKTPILKYVPKEKCNIAVSGGSESIYLDIPFDKTGLFRLSSPKAYVWHMGNVLEKDWVIKKNEELEGFTEESFSFHNLKKDVFNINLLPYSVKIFLVKVLKKLKIII